MAFKEGEEVLIHHVRDGRDSRTTMSQKISDVPVLLESIPEERLDWTPWYLMFHAPSEHTVNGR